MLVVAHRMPRTRAACERFISAGASVVECDVQLRGDTVVVSHYLPLLGIGGWVQHDNARLRWREGRVPDLTLAQALALLPDSCGVLLDPKETRPKRRRQLLDTLSADVSAPTRCRVSTDDPGDLDGYRGAGFATWRTVKNRQQLEEVLTLSVLPDAGVSIRHSLLDAGSVRALHRVTTTVVAWTVNSPDRARELRDLGVAGVTTDVLPVAAAVRSS